MDKFAVVVDRILATGQSAELALKAVMQQNPDNCVMVSMIGSPEWMRYLENLLLDIPIDRAVLDERRDENHFIFSGL
jgi:uracil phosphoribosyltransferase